MKKYKKTTIEDAKYLISFYKELQNNADEHIRVPGCNSSSCPGPDRICG